MNILVLTKRQYTNKDLLDDQFGRLRELPLALAGFGHRVTGVCLSYRAKPEGIQFDRAPGVGQAVAWHSLNLGRLVVPGIVRYAAYVRRLASVLRPDVVYSFADALYPVLGAWLARTVGTRCVIDLYDVFETFRSARLPGVLALFRHAVRHAHGVTTASAFLAEYVQTRYPPAGPIRVLVNGIDTEKFYPRSRADCRWQLGLPGHARIIGYAGAISDNRGIGTLVEAFQQLSREFDDLYLVLAGAVDSDVVLPVSTRIRYLGMLRHDRVPLLLSACDVAVICNRDNLLERGAFPQKTHEILACRVPLVAGRIDALRTLLRDYPACLYELDDLASFIQALRRQLLAPCIPDLNPVTWRELAQGLESFLEAVVRGHPEV